MGLRVPVRMQIACLTVSLAAVLAGCKPSSEAETAADPSRTKVSTEARVDSRLPDDEVKKLFRDAALCGDRRQCPELDELRRRVIAAGGEQVAMIALDLMADPESRTDQGPGKVSTSIVEEWLDARASAGGLDPALQRQVVDKLRGVVLHGSSFMRSSAYDFLGGYAMPGADRILMAEAENPERDGRERYECGRSLGIMLTDFAPIRQWLRDDNPRHWYAALAMLRTFDPDGNERRWDERRKLLVDLGRRPELPTEVVYDLAFFYDVYLDDNPRDAEILALTERWAKHPDPAAAGQMQKALLAAETKKQTPPGGRSP